MLRCRIVRTALSSHQFRNLAEIAADCGPGHTYLTTRANLQIRAIMPVHRPQTVCHRLRRAAHPRRNHPSRRRIDSQDDPRASVPETRGRSRCRMVAKHPLRPPPVRPARPFPAGQIRRHRSLCGGGPAVVRAAASPARRAVRASDLFPIRPSPENARKFLPDAPALAAGSVVVTSHRSVLLLEFLATRRSNHAATQYN